MSEQTSERERLANDLDAMRVDHLVSAALTQWSLDRIEEAEKVIRVDAILLAGAKEQLAKLREENEALRSSSTDRHWRVAINEFLEIQFNKRCFGAAFAFVEKRVRELDLAASSTERAGHNTKGEAG